MLSILPQLLLSLLLGSNMIGTTGTLAGVSGSDRAYEFSVAPPANGAVMVNVPAKVAQPAAGKGNTASPKFFIPYAGNPTLTAVSPSSGGLGQSITLTGTNLGTPTALTINGANALNNIISNSGTSLVVRVPTTAAASGNISITTANGTGGTATRAFTVMATPGNALAFDGTDDALTLPTTTAVPINNSTYTLEAWIKPTTMDALGIIGWGNYGTANQANALRLTPTGLVNYWWANDLQVTTSNLADGRWHHVAATFDGTTRSLYLDGAVVG